ncbi:hypothetical protein PPO43_05890 [Saprospira sp. CCB-QB6]|uniref:hypothetical protein n=1 Tax=Saprospira sp. CCB-QB6 TaxID=3023936 RepID=UPI00234A12F7|nr:hypothetical protein [Saprospira sp. CCB-QB6]WCL82629.1 hypothetical protein PPO43_05890 [Saprospira sp. CCB-QB6]
MHKWILSFALLAFLFVGQAASAQHSAAAPSTNSTMTANPISEMLDLLRKDYQASSELVAAANKTAQYLPTRNYEEFAIFKRDFFRKFSTYMSEADLNRLKNDGQFANILQRLYRQGGRR